MTASSSPSTNAPHWFTHAFDAIASAPNGVARLRELILSLAVQGRLVPQDESDEPASELLKRIATEKARMVKEGKLRKSASLSLFEEEEGEKPFEIPTSWQWARLDEISEKLGAGSTPLGGKEVYQTEGVKFLRSQNVWNHGLVRDNVAYISENIHQRMCGTHVYGGDILLNITGASIGRSAVVPDDIGEANVSQHVAIVRLVDKSLKKFTHLCIIAPYFQAGIMGVQVGISREGLSMSNLKEFVLPLPPLAEQKRIVARVDELMTLCDELDARQTQMRLERSTALNATLNALSAAREPDEFDEQFARLTNAFDTLFDAPESIAPLRATILQLAVQGRLVPQNESDEPATLLLERIATHKAQFGNSGRGRKNDSLSLFEDDEEKPFDIPVGWSWARFPDVGEFGRGKSKHRPRNDRVLYQNGTYPLVQTGDVARSKGVIKTYTNMYNDAGLAQSRLWPMGTLCITIAANIADSGILSFDACFPDSVVGFVPDSQFENARYFEYFLRTAKSHLEDFAPATAQRNINLEILESVLIPLPPLAEQKRIVARVDELMALCDALEAQLRASNEACRSLAESAVKTLSQV